MPAPGVADTGHLVEVGRSAIEQAIVCLDLIRDSLQDPADRRLLHTVRAALAGAAADLLLLSTGS